MSLSPLVSVIINTHNGGRFLEQAIRSVYAQTYSNFEVIVYDNASTDNTSELVRGYDPRLRHVRRESLIPLGEARNKAIAAAKGEYLCFLDSDDLFLPQKLEKQVAAFHGDVAIVYANSITMYELVGKETLLFTTPQPCGMVFRQLLKSYFLPLHTVMIRRSALGDDPAQWFNPSFSMVEETDLFLRLAHRFPLEYVDEPLAKYRIHGNNLSLNKMEAAAREREVLLQRLAATIPNFSANYPGEIRYWRSEVHYHLARSHWMKGERLKALGRYAACLEMLFRFRVLAEGFFAAIFPYSFFELLRKLKWRLAS